MSPPRQVPQTWDGVSIHGSLQSISLSLCLQSPVPDRRSPCPLPISQSLSQTWVSIIPGSPSPGSGSPSPSHSPGTPVLGLRLSVPLGPAVIQIRIPVPTPTPARFSSKWPLKSAAPAPIRGVCGGVCTRSANGRAAGLGRSNEGTRKVGTADPRARHGGPAAGRVGKLAISAAISSEGIRAAEAASRPYTQGPYRHAC